MRVTPPNEPWHPGFPSSVPRRSALDTVATAILAVFTLLAAVASFALSGYVEMATDTCGRDCGQPWVALAYLVAWGGLVVAVAVMAVGIVVAARRVTVMWIWPALAALLVFGSFFAGMMLSSLA